MLKLSEITGLVPFSTATPGCNSCAGTEVPKVATPTLTFWSIFRLTRVFRVRLLPIILACTALVFPQEGELRTSAAVLERYQRALGGVDAIKKVQSETVRGEVEAAGMQGKATFLYYAKPFKSLLKVIRSDGVEITTGFNGTVSWSITPRGAGVDKDTPLEAVRRDADLQYALHQPDYFQKLEFAGVTNFEGIVGPGGPRAFFKSHEQAAA